MEILPFFFYYYINNYSPRLPPPAPSKPARILHNAAKLAAKQSGGPEERPPSRAGPGPAAPLPGTAGAPRDPPPSPAAAGVEEKRDSSNLGAGLKGLGDVPPMKFCEVLIPFNGQTLKMHTETPRSRLHHPLGPPSPQTHARLRWIPLHFIS